MSKENNSEISQLIEKTKRLEAELKLARMANKTTGSGKVWLALDSSAEPREEEETWFSTYLDMMTLLLVLLIVMLAFSGKGDFVTGSDYEANAGDSVVAGGGSRLGVDLAIVGAGSEQLEGLQSSDKLQDKGGSLGLGEGLEGEEGEHSLSDLGFDQLGDDIDVSISAGVVNFRIKSEILFASGQADLGLAGAAVLKKLVNVLRESNFQIVVEGHTDSVPIQGRYPSNWELSGSRAGSVVRYLEANGISSKRLRAVGFADTQSLASNATAEGRAQNRRVELKMEIPK
ncbi:OmpA family protein [Pseudomonas sp. C27(2019)]|uniref:OmpA/MotB family protein n=1 Tax=Pseudomonas sp. C27(2019) TaxID=2604941 RepID=UPI001249142D|nr:OmpA family protein [Pseudomonas sp. C27(2019)]QEY59232.1 OmpA family protein [Pseudomonas sp. C27(2019)]